MADRARLAVRVHVPEEPAAAGPPVLLLHGFAADGQRDWVRTGMVAALTAAGRRAVVADLPGHGDSPAPVTSAQAGAGAIAAALVGAMDAVDRGPFDVVGYSLGARIAWELPAAAPGRVRRAVLGGLSPVDPFAALDVEAVRQAAAGGPMPADPLSAMIAGMVLAHGDRAAGLVTCVEGLRATPFEPGPWRGQEPPVFVAGREDVVTAGIERIVGLVAGASLVTVPGDHLQALAGPGLLEVVAKTLVH
ncbi:alpha/beta fold hydrolase [Nonomuraea typhae]|uniref:alpha/beta fold hydrolase n=1 Tax=Nonomuraea typhae TaxID=2603600 RepID=UPI0012FA09E4|nr:alpha/beta fold hydrolase [Nonomuraea typhae]